MKKTIAMLLLVAIMMCALASCATTEPTVVKVRFVDWDTTAKNETVIYETEVTITTAGPTLYNILQEVEKANEEAAIVYGRDENDEYTLPTEYFGRVEHDDKDVTPMVLYRWNVYVTTDKAPNENSDTVESLKTPIENGSTVTIAYLHWANQTKF